MTYRNLNSFSVALSFVTTYLFYILGILGALLALIPIAAFVLRPDLTTALICAGSVIAMAGLLAIATFAWRINQHYSDMMQNRSYSPPSNSFLKSYRDFTGIFAWIVGILAFLACGIGLLAFGPGNNLLLLTALMASFSAVGYCLIDKTY